MLKLKSRNLKPSFGWLFYQDDTLLKEGSFDDTVDLITKHRKSNRLPPGNPEQELNDYTCHRCPHLCYSDQLPHKPYVAASSITDKAAKFLGVFDRWSLMGFEVEEQVEANRRGDICLKCPSNQQVTEQEEKKGCCGRGKLVSVMHDVAKSVAKALTWPAIRNRVTPADGGLFSCAVCGCANRPSLWIPLKAFNYSAEEKAEFKAANSACWKSS